MQELQLIPVFFCASYDPDVVNFGIRPPGLTSVIIQMMDGSEAYFGGFVFLKKFFCASVSPDKQDCQQEGNFITPKHCSSAKRKCYKTIKMHQKWDKVYNCIRYSVCF